MPLRPPAPPVEDMLQLLLAQSEDYALFFMDAEGVVTDWFRGAQRVFGYTVEEAVGKPFGAFFNEEDLARGADRHELDLARSTGRSEDDRWHVRKDGTLFWGSGITQAIRGADGKVIGFAKIARNRTDLKTQTEALEREWRALSRRDEQARTFLAILGHELRNPLAPLSNAAALLRNAASSDAVTQQAMRVIDRQVSVIARLANDIMEMTRAAAGKVDLQRRELDLRELVRDVVESARPQAQARDQDLQAVLIESEILVDGDPDRLQQVFQNLVNNALKYTPLGGRITVHATTEGGDAVTRVEDNGFGMSSDVLPTIFDLFTQENASREASGGGLGLGLPLVRELVSLHGGTVQARSDGRGKGSVFTVRLPLLRTVQT